jgi:cytochrome c oxidase cbb3-type subunit III
MRPLSSLRLRVRPWAAPLVVLAAAAAACMDSSSNTPRPTVTQAVLRTSELQAGPTTADYAARNPYDGDSNALTQGRRLFTDMNCAGCHGANGGGGIGPPLADSDWIYGGQLENIVQSIMQGRPEGMPAFSPRLPEDEAWKIANYVVSMAKKSSGKVSSTTSASDPGAPSK